MNRKIFIVFILILSKGLWAQITYGPTQGQDVYFSDCKPMQWSAWSVKDPILNCKKVVFNCGDSKLCPTFSDVYVAPKSWDQGLKEILNFSSSKSFCLSLGQQFCEGFKSIFSNKTFIQYTPYKVVEVKDPEGTDSHLLIRGFYDASQVRTLNDIEDLEISGVMYPFKENDSGVTEDNPAGVYDFIVHESGQQSVVYAKPNKRKPNKNIEANLATEVRALVTVIQAGKNIEKLAKATEALKQVPFVEKLLGTLATVGAGVTGFMGSHTIQRPLYATLQPGMFDQPSLPQALYGIDVPDVLLNDIDVYGPQYKARKDAKLNKEPLDKIKLVSIHWLRWQAELCDAGLGVEEYCEEIYEELGRVKSEKTLAEYLQGRGETYAAQLEELRNTSVRAQEVLLIVKGNIVSVNVDGKIIKFNSTKDPQTLVNLIARILGINGLSKHTQIIGRNTYDRELTNDGTTIWRFRRSQ